MDEPASDSAPDPEVDGDATTGGDGAAEGRSLVEQFFLAGLGAVALTAERADRLADELAERGGIQREEARQSVEHARARWRGDSIRIAERASESLATLFRELGLVTRDEWEELELRVAQLEHRLRLVEGEPEPPRPGQAGLTK